MIDDRVERESFTEQNRGRFLDRGTGSWGTGRTGNSCQFDIMGINCGEGGIGRNRWLTTNGSGRRRKMNGSRLVWRLRRSNATIGSEKTGGTTTTWWEETGYSCTSILFNMFQWVDFCAYLSSNKLRSMHRTLLHKPPTENPRPVRPCVRGNVECRVGVGIWRQDEEEAFNPPQMSLT